MELKNLHKQPIGTTHSVKAILSKVEVRSAKNGSKFGLIRLRDKGKELSTISFDTNTNEKLPKVLLPCCVDLTVSVELYQGKPSFKITHLFNTSKDIPDELLTVHPSAESIDVAISMAVQFANKENRLDLEAAIRRFWESKLYARFLVAPAAVGLHHACKGGLAGHTAEVVKATQGILSAMPHDSDVMAPGSYSMAIALVGALWHDIGKIKAFDYDDQVLSTKYTREGSLFDHIALGYKMMLDVFESGTVNVPLAEREAILHIIHFSLISLPSFLTRSGRRSRNNRELLLPG